MSDTVEARDAISPPRTVVLAFAALVTYVVVSIGNAVMLWGFSDYLRQQLVDANNKLKPTDKNFKANYTPAQQNHDLHNWLTAGLVQALVFGFALVLLGISVRRGRGWARWVTVVVLVFPIEAPFRLLGLGGHGPILTRLASALIGLSGLAVIVLLILPETSRYFAAVRARNAGGGEAGPATGWRGMFAPRSRDAGPLSRSRTSSRTSAKASSSRASSQPKPDATAKASPAAKRAAIESPTTAEPQVAAERRAKAKVRAGTESSAEARPAPVADKPPPAAKNRGKSRKGS